MFTIEDKPNYLLIHADSTNEALEYLLRQKVQADLIVDDPDYRNIDDNMVNGHYEHINYLLKKNHPLVHYT